MIRDGGCYCPESCSYYCYCKWSWCSQLQLVDILQINHTQTIGMPLQQTFRGIYEFVRMNLTITVFCEERFEGSDCAQCVRGFTGPDCEQIDCSANSCSGNGVCVDNTIGTPSCDCSAGFTGRICEINIDDCSPSPCGENGLCLDGVGNFTCECAPGFGEHLCNYSGTPLFRTPLRPLKVS